MPCGKLCSATQNWIKIVYQIGKNEASQKTRRTQNAHHTVMDLAAVNHQGL